MTFAVLTLMLAADPLTVRGIDGSLATLAPAKLADAKWFSLQAARRPPFPTGEQAILANGDRIPGQFVRGDDTIITLKVREGEWKLPITSLDVLWLAKPGEATFPDQYRWMPAERTGDVVLLATGEVLSGVFEKFTERDELLLVQDGKTRTLLVSVVQAIAFNPALAIRKPPVSRFAIVLADGTRLTAKEFAVTDSEVAVTTSFNLKLKLKWNEIAAVTHWTADVVDLASVKPVKVEQVPAGSITWNWTANRSVKNNPLTLKTARGVETFDSGLGTHARTVLTYDIAGKYRTFEATVGLDATTGRRGSVVVKVLVDGVEKVSFDPLAGTDEPKALRVEVSKAKSLTLVTDFGAASDVQADVDWIDARLMK